MENLHGNMHVFVLFMSTIYMKAQKHVCFDVFSPFSASLHQGLFWVDSFSGF